MENNIAVIVRSEDCLPEETLCPRLLECLFKDAIPLGKFTTDINESEMAVHGEGRDDYSFYELVRVAFNDDAILACSGLAFIGVAAKIDGLACVFRNKA